MSVDVTGKRTYSFRLSSILRDKLVEEAAKEGRSTANMLERILEERYGARTPPLPERPRTTTVAPAEASQVRKKEQCTHPSHGRKGWVCKGCGEIGS